jgi:stearoyl-CoA desaturase (delta-9 desaturase)
VSLRSLLISQPITQFKRDPRFYLKYDTFWALTCLALSIAMLATGHRSFFGPFRWTQLAWFPAVLFVVIQSHVHVHNATHGSLPRLLNRVLGELLGLVIVVRYASWDIVHMRHHKYSDDPVKDPHPAYPSYLKSFWKSIVTVEQQLMAQYYETWGDTPENRKKEALRAKVSYGTNVLLLAAWHVALGPGLFWLVFVPANILGAMFIGHFNWATHNGERKESFRPVNLNSGYYWLGNRLFFGIYYHANHHKRPNLFNPMWWDEKKYGPADVPVDAPSYVPEAIPEIATATKKTSGKTGANATEDRAVA